MTNGKRNAKIEREARKKIRIPVEKIYVYEVWNAVNFEGDGVGRYFCY